MNDEFVTVATCQFVNEAESIKLILAQEGIDAFIADANTVNINWFLGPAVGYIKVQVALAQEQAARTLIEKHPRGGSEAADNAPATCLACGSPLPEDTDICPNCGWTYRTVESDSPPQNEV